MTAKIIDNIFATGYKGMLSDPNLKTAKAWGCVRMVQMNDPVTMTDTQIVDYYNSNPYNTTKGILCVDQEGDAEFDWNSADNPPSAYAGSAKTYKGLDLQVTRIKKLIPGCKVLVYSFAPCGSDYGRLAYGNGTQMATNYDGANAIPEAVQLRADVDGFGMEEYEWKGLDNLPTNFAKWISICQNSAKIARKLNPGKPLCGFIYGRQGDDQSVYVPATQFRQMLETMFPLFDYIIVWYTSANAIASQDVWYPTLCDYMNNTTPGVGNGDLIAGDGGGPIPPPVDGLVPVNMATQAIAHAPTGTVATAFYSAANGVPAGYTPGSAAVLQGYKATSATRIPLYRVKSSDGRYALTVGAPNYTPGSGWVIDGPVMCYIEKSNQKDLLQLMAAVYTSPDGKLYVGYADSGAPPLGYKYTGEQVGFVVPAGITPPPPVDQSKSIALLNQSNAAIIGSVPNATQNIHAAITALGG